MIGVAVAAFALLLFTWLGYPAVMAILAVAKGRAARPVPADWPHLSVVIASRDPFEDLRARITDVLAARYPHDRLEVIAALDANSPVDAGQVEALGPRCRAVRAAEAGKAAALNAGAGAARGELLVFTDTFQRFEPDALRRLASALDDPAFGAVSGRLELSSRARRSAIDLYWRVERRLRQDEATVHSAVGVTGAIYAMRRALWTALPQGLILDDLYVPMCLVLAGHRIGFAEDARAIDTRSPQPAQEYRRKVRTLTGNFQLCAWLPAVLVPGRNPIWAQFVFHKLLRLLTPWLVVVGGLAASAAIIQWGGWRVLAGAAALVTLAGLAAAATGQWARLRAVVAWGFSMQLAIVTATINGLTARWDVWRR